MRCFRHVNTEFSSHILSLNKLLKDMHVQKQKLARRRVSKTMNGLQFSPACKVIRLLPQSNGCWQKTHPPGSETKDCYSQLQGRMSFLFPLFFLTPQISEGQCRAAEVAAAHTLGLAQLKTIKFRNPTMFSLSDYVCLLSFHSFKEAVSKPAQSLT